MDFFPPCSNEELASNNEYVNSSPPKYVVDAINNEKQFCDCLGQIIKTAKYTISFYLLDALLAIINENK